jgi:hypothetical protein
MRRSRFAGFIIDCQDADLAPAARDLQHGVVGAEDHRQPAQG